MRNSHRLTHNSGCWFANSLLILLYAVSAGFGVSVGASNVLSSATSVPASGALPDFQFETDSIFTQAIRFSSHPVTGIAKHHPQSFFQGIGFQCTAQQAAARNPFRLVSLVRLVCLARPDTVTLNLRPMLSAVVNQRWHGRAKRGKSGHSRASASTSQSSAAGSPASVAETHAAARRQLSNSQSTILLPRLTGFTGETSHARELNSTYSKFHVLFAVEAGVSSQFSIF